MYKDFILLAALAAFSQAAWCDDFYVGLGVGPEMASFNQNKTVTSPGSTFVKDNTHLAGIGAFGSIFAGYELLRNAFYVAAEADFNYTGVKFKTSNSELIHFTFSDTYYRMRRAFGLSLLPGYQFNHLTLFYGRIGYNVSGFQISTDSTDLHNVDTNLSAVRWGLGIKQRINNMLAVRMEYSQAYYETFSTSTFDAGGNTTIARKIAPTTGQVEFALIYNFG